MSVEFVKRLEWSFNKRGFTSTLTLCTRYAVSSAGDYFGRLLDPFAYRERVLQKHKQYLIEKQLDGCHNIETLGEVHPYDLKAYSSNVIHGHRYQPTAWGSFGDVIRHLRVACEEFVFVDFGSGKGRVLFMASNFPFKRIVGIEFSPKLSAIAERNIRNYRNQDQKCHVLQSLCMDAVDYPLPSEPAVFYFYNPFQESVLQSVAANIRASFYRHPREMVIVYQNPIFANVFDVADFLQRIETPEKDYALYTAKV
jgi:SAM-dependent methyltransferase